MNKLGKDGPFLADINGASQYVYGKRKGDEKEDIYLVDTDLYIRDSKVAFYNIVLWLAIHVISVERKYGKKFEGARGIIERIVSEPLPGGLTDEGKPIVERIIAKTRKYLAGQKVDFDEEEVNPVFGY